MAIVQNFIFRFLRTTTVMHDHSYLNMVGSFPKTHIDFRLTDWNQVRRIMGAEIFFSSELRPFNNSYLSEVANSLISMLSFACVVGALQQLWKVLQHWLEGWNFQLLNHKEVTKFQRAPTQIPVVFHPAMIGRARADSMLKLTVRFNSFWSNRLNCIGLSISNTKFTCYCLRMKLKIFTKTFIF